MRYVYEMMVLVFVVFYFFYLFYNVVVVVVVVVVVMWLFGRSVYSSSSHNYSVVLYIINSILL